MRRTLLLLISALWFVTGCEHDDEAAKLPVPEAVGPTGNVIFYPDQEVKISWKVPDSTKTVEIQSITSTDSLLYKEGKTPFETADFVQRYTNTTSTASTWHNSLNQKLYIGYRMRYAIITNPFQPNERKEYSDWSEIHYYRVYPFSELSIRPLTIQADFDFVTQLSGHYYSGVTRSLDYISIDSLIVANGYPLAKLKFIKPATGTVVDQGNRASDLARVAIGFVAKPNPDQPLDILADAYALSVNSRLTFYPFGGIYRNLYDDLGKRKTNMILAYILNNNQGVGVQHQVKVNLTVDCYFEK